MIEGRFLVNLVNDSGRPEEENVVHFSLDIDANL